MNIINKIDNLLLCGIKIEQYIAITICNQWLRKVYCYYYYWLIFYSICYTNNNFGKNLKKH